MHLVARDPQAAARVAGLRYTRDTAPGIRRQRVGRGFVYLRTDGRRIADAHVLRRIRALAIPPAWTAVWICPRAEGHIQAAGRDARGRKQYRYHAEWRRVRDEAKFNGLLSFARCLHPLRARVRGDLARRGLPREKVLATVVRLLETTLVRVGNAEYARANGSFGLTTLRDHHAVMSARRVRFRFRGKSGRLHEVAIADRRIARIVRRCQELPGQELFQYVADDGRVVAVGSADVNAYLREAAGVDVTAKDFRTWAGSVLALLALSARPAPRSPTEGKRMVVEAIRGVARQLGNTPAVCRRCYVHPVVIDAYLEGLLPRARPSSDPGSIAAGERALVRLLQERARRSPIRAAS